MSTSGFNVLHVVDSDVSLARLETLRALCTQPGLGRQRVVQLGNGRVACSGLATLERLPVPFGIHRLAARRLRRMLPATERTVLHVWTTTALPAVISAGTSGGRGDATKWRAHLRLLVDVEAPCDFHRLAGAVHRLRSAAVPRFACPTDTVQRRLLETGVPADACVVIRDAVDLAAFEAAGRPEVRSRLGLSPEHTVVLVLPPALRETGAFVAGWATMLLTQVRRDVRLVVPDTGREVDRLARLVESCRHGWMLRLARRHFALCDLLAAADLAVYLPSGDAPLSGVAWALVAGRPIVATAVPATADLLTHGQNAWLCRPDSPKEAARRMLQALENPQQSRRQAESARSQALHAFRRGRMIEQYARAYENLLAGRCIADGIEEAPLAR